MEANQYLNDFYKLLRRGQPPAVSARQRRISHHDALHREISQARRQSPRDRRRNGPLFSRAGALGASCGRGGAGRAQHRGFPPNLRPGERHQQGLMLWICPPFATTPTMSRFCSARFIICIPGTTSAGRCGKAIPRLKAGRRCLCRLCHPRRLPSGRGLPPRQYPVAEYVRDGLPAARTFAASSQQRICSSWCAKRMLMSWMSVFPVTRLHYVASDLAARPALRDEI